MATREALRYSRTACKESASLSAGSGSARLENFIGSLVAPAPGPETDRALPLRGRPLVYMPLSAFGVYDGEVLAARDDGRVDVGLWQYFGAERRERQVFIDLTRIEVVASRDLLRPGTCFLLPPA